MYREMASVRPSTFLNDISSEAVGRILSIFHIKHPRVGGTKRYVFYSGWIKTLVAMATYSSHRLIMGKAEIAFFFFCLNGDIWNFFFTEMFIE